MRAEDFYSIRKMIGKTQKQMSEILGVSLKAIQSFEQGWRRIPVHVERQALYLLAMKMGSREHVSPCWEILHCPRERLEMCPSWEFKSGHLCWFINGTVCQGKPRGSWSKKMALCRKCEVFTSLTKHWGLAPGERTVRHRKRK